MKQTEWRNGRCAVVNCAACGWYARRGLVMKPRSIGWSSYTHKLFREKLERENALAKSVGLDVCWNGFSCKCGKLFCASAPQIKASDLPIFKIERPRNDELLMRQYMRLFGW